MENNMKEFMSRSERRELERRENRFNQPSGAGQILRRVLLWGGILGGSVLLIIGLAYLGSKSSSSNISGTPAPITRSEEHTSELQSQFHLVCRLLLEKKDQ